VWACGAAKTGVGVGGSGKSAAGGGLALDGADHVSTPAGAPAVQSGMAPGIPAGAPAVARGIPARAPAVARGMQLGVPAMALRILARRSA
jgi:hypothetical protein